MPIYIRSSFSTLGTLSARSEGAEQIGSTVHSSILWSYRDESDLPVFTEMYQFNLAKDLKEHKTFPLNLKFTTDLRSLTEVFSSGRLVVLFHVSETIGLSDLWQLSLLHWSSCIIQICYWTWLLHSNGLQASWVEDETYYSWFFQEYFYHQGRNSASGNHSTLWAEIKLFQYLVLPLTDISCFWLTGLHSIPL